VTCFSEEVLPQTLPGHLNSAFYPNLPLALHLCSILILSDQNELGPLHIKGLFLLFQGSLSPFTLVFAAGEVS